MCCSLYSYIAMLIYGGPLTWPNWGKRIAENPSTVPGSEISQSTIPNMNKDPIEQIKMRADQQDQQ